MDWLYGWIVASVTLVTLYVAVQPGAAVLFFRPTALVCLGAILQSVLPLTYKRMPWHVELRLEAKGK